MRSAVSERGGNASRARERRQVGRSLNGHESASRKQAKAVLEPLVAVLWRGTRFSARVSTAKWNPKGMRRSTGL